MKPGKGLFCGLCGIAILVMTGCGYKGPLVLPEQAVDNQTEQQKTPEPQTSPQNQEK